MRWLVVLSIALAGCGRDQPQDPGPPCAEVMDHILAVTKNQLVGHGDMVLGQRDAMIGQCEARKLPADKRRCLMAANTLDAIASCKAGDPNAAPYDPRTGEKPRKKRPPRDRGLGPVPAPPLPAGSGSGSAAP
jgi:hypothetical protein